MDSRQTREIHPSARALGDAVLVASGALDPLDRFVCEREGRRIRDRGQLLDGAAFPVPVTLTLPESDVDGLSEGDRVVLVDGEGAPVAEVLVDSLWSAAHNTVGLAGPVRGLAAPGHAFASLGRPAREVRRDLGAASAVGALVDRPLLAEEVSALASVADPSRVLLLVRTVDPQVPADVLVKSLLAAATQIPGSEVITVPLARRADRTDDQALAEIVVRNYGARPAHGLTADSEWLAVKAALDEDDEVSLHQRVDPATLNVLRRWRPPRPSRGLVVFFTGLSGSGKSTIARSLVDRLHETDRTVTVLDGDVARRMLSSGLGFSRQDRDTNIRRLGWVGAEVARHGGAAVLAPIAPFAATRAEVRRMVEAVGDLVLVWVSTPLEECERRDRKGLYAKARRGEIPDFTGISSPYEQPDDADLVIDTTEVDVAAAVDRVWDHLVSGKWITEPRTTPAASADPTPAASD